MIRRLASLAFALCCAIALLSGIARAAQRTVPTTHSSVAAYARVLHTANPQMPGWQSASLARKLLMNAARWKVSPNVLAAIVTVESAWHTHAVSYAGAVGLGQLMPGTAAALGVNPRNPEQNLAGAARYLGGLLAKFGSDPRRYELAFAAYNAGPKAVERYGGIPPYAQTQHYVLKVLRVWHHLQRTVHIPKAALAALPQGPDINYWLKDDAR